MKLIFTMCYDHPNDAGIVDDINTVAMNSGGTVHFVHLTCDVEELFKRVN